MNKKHQILLSLLILTPFFCFDSDASSLKASGASGANKYQDWGLLGKWGSEDGGKALTSVQSTKSSGSTTNEYKLGYCSKFSEVTSYNLDAYFRSEPSSVSVLGLNPELSFDYDDLIFSDLSTGFTLGLDFSRSSYPIQVGLKKANESFTAAGASLGFTQEIFSGLKASLSGAFYHYTQPQTKLPIAPKRLTKPRPIGVGTDLSSLGDPEKTFTLELSWDWAEKWSSAYSLSSSKAHFDGLTTIYSNLGVDHTFSNQWSTGLSYSWSSAATSAGGLEITYSW